MAGRPPSNILDAYFADIQTLYSEEALSPRAIQARLQERYGLSISYQTIARKIQQWGLEKGQILSDVTRNPEVITFVKQEWLDNCSHQEILTNISRAMPHIEITDRQLRTLREREKIIYRRRGDIPPEEQEEAKAAIEAVLIAHGGAYGRELVQVALRRDGVLVSQLQVRNLQKELDPQGVCYILYPASTIVELGLQLL